VVDYPREWEPMIDETSLRTYLEPAFEFHLVKRPVIENRARLAKDQTLASLTPLDLLDLYLLSKDTPDNESDELKKWPGT